MRFAGSIGVAVTALALSAGSGFAQLTLNFASTTGSTIQFNGTSSSFQFNPVDGTQWQIGSETGGTGSAIGLYGQFDNGPFGYGAITVNNSIPGLDYETAMVSGPLGALSVADGVGNFLTGDVNWIEVATANSAGSINGSLTVNVTGLNYTGPNADLQTVAANGPGSMNLTFQFSPGKTLTQLTSGTGPYNTSFSGSLSVVPEPATLASLLLGFGLLASRKWLKGLSAWL